VTNNICSQRSVLSRAGTYSCWFHWVCSISPYLCGFFEASEVEYSPTAFSFQARNWKNSTQTLVSLWSHVILMYLGMKIAVRKTFYFLY